MYLCLYLMTPLSDVWWGCWENRCGLKLAFDCVCVCICVWSLSSGVGGLGKSLWIEACFRFPLLFLPSRSLLMPAGSWHFDRTKAIHGLMMTMMIMVDDNDDDDGDDGWWWWRWCLRWSDLCACVGSAMEVLSPRPRRGPTYQSQPLYTIHSHFPNIFTHFFPILYFEIWN